MHRSIWGYLNHEKDIEESKVYLHVSNNLCNHKLFITFAKGHWMGSKGCYDLYRKVKGVIKKMHYKNGATLHPQHRRCNVTASRGICSPGQSTPILLQNHNRKFHNYPFIVKTTNGALVSRSGMLSLPCGPFGLLSSCEALNWVSWATSLILSYYTAWSHRFSPQIEGNKNCKFIYKWCEYVSEQWSWQNLCISFIR